MLAVDLMVSEMKILLSFSFYKSMEAINKPGCYLDLQTMTICTNFQSPFNTRLHMKFEAMAMTRGSSSTKLKVLVWLSIITNFH